MKSLPINTNTIELREKERERERGRLESAVKVFDVGPQRTFVCENIYIGIYHKFN